MLLLLTMIILKMYFSQGGFIQEYPYFSQDVGIGSNEKYRAVQNVNRHKMTKNIIVTFDPASVRALNEYIWIDHQ